MASEEAGLRCLLYDMNYDLVISFHANFHAIIISMEDFVKHVLEEIVRVSKSCRLHRARSSVPDFSRARSFDGPSLVRPSF